MKEKKKGGGRGGKGGVLKIEERQKIVEVVGG